MFPIVLCRSIEPTLLLNPPLDSDIMTEEIFGPLLPIITVSMSVLADAFLLAESEWSRRYLSTEQPANASHICFLQVKKIEDSIKFLKSKPKPLAIYAFTRNEKLKQRIIDETSSGSVTFNDAIVQVRSTDHSLLP